MEKLILKDKTEIEIQEGANLSSIKVMLQDYTGLMALAGKLTTENLQKVSFLSDKIVAAEYENMVLMEPNFSVTQLKDSLQVSFGIREYTQEEMQQEDVQTAIGYLNDEQALSVSGLYPEWSPRGEYKEGERVRYNNVLYRCLDSHTAQETWTPETSPSLWAKVLPGQSGDVGEWQQPDSTNGYSTGDRVTHNGKTWESRIDNNVWEPGAIGAEELWTEIK